MGFRAGDPFTMPCFIWAETISTTALYSIRVLLAALVSLLVPLFSPN